MKLRPLILLAAAALPAFVPTAAGACDWDPGQGAVLGVAADGSFVHHTSSYYDDRVELFDAQGKLRAGCTRNNDSNDRGAWECRGEKAFRGRPKEQPIQAARRWAGLLGGVTPLSTAGVAPQGVIEAFCSRIVFVTSGGNFSCRPKDDLRVVTHPASPLVFFRYRISFFFCGPMPNVEEDDTWLSRPALARLLRRRIVKLERGKASEPLERATAALAWLERPPEHAAEKLPYLLYRPYDVVIEHTDDVRLVRAARRAKLGFHRAEKDYAEGRYGAAARQFLQVAGGLRAVRDPWKKMIPAATENQVLCYRNAALALRMAGRCAAGRAELLKAAEPDGHIAAEVRAVAEGMGLEGPEAADCP